MPALDQLLDESPQVVAGPGVQPGGRLVEEQHRRSGDQAGTDVEPPAHPSRVGLHHPVGGVGEPETLQDLVCPGAVLLASQVVPQADQFEVLPPGEQLVDGGVLSGQTYGGAQRAGIGDHVAAGDPCPPPSGRSRVVRIRTMVVLPEPLARAGPAPWPPRRRDRPRPGPGVARSAFPAPRPRSSLLPPDLLE